MVFSVRDTRVFKILEVITTYNIEIPLDNLLGIISYVKNMPSLYNVVMHILHILN